MLLVAAVLPSFLAETHFAGLAYSLLWRWTPERRQLDYVRMLGASVQSAKEVKIFGLGDYLVERYQKLADRFYQENRRLALRRAGVGRLVVVNRTLARAEALASEVGGTARPLEELFTLLATADVVVSGTSSPVPLFTRENVAPALETRQRPLVMVDLAVPRDIAPELGSMKRVHVLDVDDIQRFVLENAAARAEEARKAEALVAEEVARFMRERAVRDGVPVLSRLRQRADAIARTEVERTLSSLGESLSDKQRKSVEAMARAIINKLLHEPTARLRAVGTEQEDKLLAHVTAELFGLQG